MSELGLNDHHVLQALNFIRFCRYKRYQRLRAVDLCFQDVKDTRLYDNTYTLDEVNEILEGLLDSVRAEMESELLHSSHTSVLLLRQLLSQAEKWHLKLSADMSELENRELLEKVADFEKRETDGQGNTAPVFIKQTIAPQSETGGVALLQRQIEKLQTENEKFQEDDKTMSEHLTLLSKENQDLKKQLKELGVKPVVAKGNEDELKKLEAKLGSLKSKLSTDVASRSAENDKLSAQLAETMQNMLKVQEQLEMTEKELDKKFRETGAYKNLREMLGSKNEQIKTLRKRLQQFENQE